MDALLGAARQLRQRTAPGSSPVAQSSTPADSDAVDLAAEAAEDWDVIESSDGIPHDPAFTIATSHWVLAAERPHCMAPGCARTFNIVDKRSWCFRCGETFCKKCLRYRRRLALNAQPDPHAGSYYPVCLRCFQEQPQQQLGCVRNKTDSFHYLRKHILRQRDARLHQAAAKLAASFVQYKRSALAVGDQWSKVNVVPSPQLAADCQACSTKFVAFSRQRYACRLCGLDFCRQCVFRSIEVFLVSETAAQIDVLHPDNERRNSTAVWGCDRCLNHLEKASKLQLRLKLKERGEADTTAPTPAFTKVVELYNSRLCQARNGATRTLLAYQDTVEYFCSEQTRSPSSASDTDTLSSSTHSGVTPRSPISPAAAPRPKISVRTVAKQQTDLGFFYEELTAAAHQMAKLVKGAEMKPTELKCAQNVVLAAMNLYQDHLADYRRCRRDLAEFLPQPVIDTIQSHVNVEVFAVTYATLVRAATDLMVFELLEPLASQVLSTLEEIKQEWRIEASYLELNFEDEVKTAEELAADFGRSKPLCRQYAQRPNWKPAVLKVWDDTLRKTSEAVRQRSSAKASGKTRAALAKLWKLGTQMLTNDVADEPESDWVLV